jgi:LysM repeat protein
MVRKKVYYKKPNYQKLAIDLIRKKYLSLVLGLLLSYFVSSFIYRQFIVSKIHFLNFKNFNFSFLKINKKTTSSSTFKKPEKKEKEYQLYTVVEGDSLSSIAEKFYGDLYKWPLILEYNNLNNPDNIEIGMVLKIPKITQ